MHLRHRLSLLSIVVLAAPGCAAQTAGDGAADPEQTDEAFTAAKPLFADKIGPERTRYPIYLEHGFASSAEPASIWKFAGVADDLMKQGYPLVVAADVEPFNDAATRAKTMEKNIRALAARCAAMPDGKCDPSGVHIIAHSFGGLDAREYIRQHPTENAVLEGLPRVVSLTTVATPNHGSNIADFGLSIIEAFKNEPAVDAFLEGAINKMAGLVGTVFTKEELLKSPDIAGALHDLSEKNADRFAAEHPPDPAVRYYAWAGVSVNPNVFLHPFHPDRVKGKMPASCGAPLAKTDHAYATDPLLVGANEITGHFFDGVPNDGMATVESAKALPGARFMGCLPADHLADVGHTSDEKKKWSGFDPTFFYRYIANVVSKDVGR